MDRLSPKFLDRLRQASPTSFKLRIARAIASPTVGDVLNRAFAHRIPHYRFRIPTHGPGVSRETAAELFFRLYERAEIDLVRRFLPSELDVIELGSSLGVNTCHIAGRLHKHRRVIALEADPRLAEHTAKTLTMNALEKKVTVVSAALDYEGRAYASLDLRESSLNATTLTHGGSRTSQVNVPTVTLSELIQRYGIREYCLVADIEGAEIPLFLKDVAALRDCKLILIELDGGQYGDRAYGPDDVQRLIEAAGFEQIYRHGNCGAFRRH